MHYKTLLASIVTWLVKLVWGFVMRLRYSDTSVTAIDDSLLLLPAVQIAEKIRSGELTCTKIVQAYIRRIKQVNESINAVVDNCFDEALQVATQVDEQLAALRAANDSDALQQLFRDKPLLGVPVSIKTSFAVEGKRWTGGLWALRNRKAKRYTNEVERIRQAGAIITCTTNMPEMAMWLESHNPVHGLTRNPHNLSRIPGGSSGGEGALLAAAGSVIGLGSDIGGSVRIPAGACGIFAHKPSPYLEYDPDFFAHSPSCQNTTQQKMGVFGPMCRYASDLWPLLNTFLSESGKSKLRAIEPKQVDFKRTKFLYYKHAVGDESIRFCSADDYVLKTGTNELAALEKVLDYVKNELQADVSPLEFDEEFSDLRMNEIAPICITYLLTPDNFDAPRSDWRSLDGKPWNDIVTVLSGYDSQKRHSLCVEVTKKVLAGFGMLAQTQHSWPALWLANMDRLFTKMDASIKRALLRRGERFEQAFEALFAKYKRLYDNVIILSPVWPTTPYHHEPLISQTADMVYTGLYNVTGLPVTVAPILKDKSTNLPAGVQIATARYDDAVSIALAQRLEEVFGGWKSPA